MFCLISTILPRLFLPHLRRTPFVIPPPKENRRDDEEGHNAASDDAKEAARGVIAGVWVGVVGYVAGEGKGLGDDGWDVGEEGEGGHAEMVGWW